VYSLEQMAEMVTLPDLDRPEGLRDRAMIAVLASTAIRASELCDLRVADVTERQLFVRHGKGGSPRYVPMTALAWAAVTDYLVAYPARAGEPLFRTGPGRGLTRRRLHKAVSAYSRRLHLGQGVHVLRSSAATAWLNSGVNLRHVQLGLGHAKIETTAIYLKTATHALIADFRRHFEPMLAQLTE